MVALKTFTVIWLLATGSAPAGGHGYGSCEAVGLGAVAKSRANTGRFRLPVKIAAAPSPASARAARSTPKMTACRSCMWRRRSCRARSCSVT